MYEADLTISFKDHRGRALPMQRVRWDGPKLPLSLLGWEFLPLNP